MRFFYLFIIVTILSSCNGDETPEHDSSIETPHVSINEPKIITYKVINQYPHDTSAYTQGLEIHNGKLYESTGDYENSSLRITNAKSGKVEKKHMMGSSE